MLKISTERPKYERRLIASLKVGDVFVWEKAFLGGGFFVVARSEEIVENQKDQTVKKAWIFEIIDDRGQLHTLSLPDTEALDYWVKVRA